MATDDDLLLELSTKMTQIELTKYPPQVIISVLGRTAAGAAIVHRIDREIFIDSMEFSYRRMLTIMRDELDKP